MPGRSLKKKRASPPAVLVAASLRPLQVEKLRQDLQLNRRVFSRLVGYSERAIADWEAGKEVRGASRQRLTEIQRLQAALARVMKPEFVGAWLQAPNPAFAGLKPIEVVERGEMDRLWRMIFRVESGHPG